MYFFLNETNVTGAQFAALLNFYFHIFIYEVSELLMKLCIYENIFENGEYMTFKF